MRVQKKLKKLTYSLGRKGLNWEKEEKKVKKWCTLQKVKNYGTHNTRSQTLYTMYLT
jgi:hypothetical protein